MGKLTKSERTPKVGLVSVDIKPVLEDDRMIFEHQANWSVPGYCAFIGPVGDEVFDSITFTLNDKEVCVVKDKTDGKQLPFKQFERIMLLQSLGNQVACNVNYKVVIHTKTPPAIVFRVATLGQL